MNRRLIEARKQKGFTQEQLAKLIGVDRTTYAHYERGKTPLLITALKVAHVLNVPVEDIFSLSDVQNMHTDPTGTDN